MDYWMELRTVAVNGLCWKSRTKVTDRFVLAAGCPAVNGKYISYVNKKQNRTQHNLTAPTEDVFELMTHS
jgi:hypothetical protein